MVFLFTPGNALGCNVNAHRHGWAGGICTDAASWSCSAEQDFRENYCARGDGRCYHVHLFDPKSTRFVIDDNGAGWMLNVDMKALDDQILVIWGGDFAEPRGLRDGATTRGPVYGAYRVKQCRRLSTGYRDLWEVTPHSDGWTRFHNLRITRPVHRSLAGKYLREVDRAVTKRLFDDAMAAAQDRSTTWFDAKDAERLEHFHDHLDDWFDKARAAADGRGLNRPAAPLVRLTSGPQPTTALAGLSAVIKARPDPAPTTASSTPATAPTLRISPAAATSSVVPPAATPAPVAVPNPSSEPPPLLEATAEARVVEIYGQDTLLALRVASLTKTLLVLRGDTGVGKSTLAINLLADPTRERTLVVPIAATWRGREDLLGYVNPVSSEFEPTEFTRFLFAAHAAWQKGDRRTRAVVFEEFNLAQPEHWLADLLVVSQYGTDAERVVHLGGKSVRGIEGTSTRLHLSPSVRFVATMNTDHTTRSLSPRVLDRAAIVELTMEPAKALQVVGLQMRPELFLAIQEIAALLTAKGASFSLRTARSLAACIKQIDTLGISDQDALDLVLLQDMLSKVGLLARDPGDEALARELAKWSERHGNLRRCAQAIEQWIENLAAGIDVAHS